MSKVFNITSYSSSFTDYYFFDANIWLYIFCPIANYQKKKQQEYSAFFKSLTSANRNIIITSLVTSEFCNRWLRIDFDLWKKSTGNSTADYKRDFVQTSQFQQTVKDIKATLSNIFKVSMRHGDDFHSIDFAALQSDFGRVDFNDAYYIKQAIDKKWKIVTHDSDIINSSHPVEIITST